jgi:nucleoside-diphosphate kinase
MASNIQKTLVLLKPDAVHRHLVGTVLQRFEHKGLRIVAMKIMHAGQDLAAKHYAVHKDKPFYQSLLSFLTSGPMVAMVMEGREAIGVVRNLIGPTDGAKAPPGTIRGDFALSVQNNLIHGSDSPETAAAEVALWFRPDELVNYQMIDVALITGVN